VQTCNQKLLLLNRISDDDTRGESGDAGLHDVVSVADR